MLVLPSAEVARSAGGGLQVIALVLRFSLASGVRVTFRLFDKAVIPAYSGMTGCVTFYETINIIYMKMHKQKIINGFKRDHGEKSTN